MRDIVAALAQDFDVMDVAAAAIKMIHDAFDKGTPEVVEEVEHGTVVQVRAYGVA